MKRVLFILSISLPSSLPSSASAAPEGPIPASAPVGPASPGDAAAPAARKVKKPLVATVLGEVRRVPGYEKTRPYTAPDLDPETPPEPSDVKTLEVTEDNEALVLVRPFYPSPLLGAVVNGARVPVKGVVHAKTGRGCPPRLWYALDPFGYVCARSVRPTTEAPTTDAVLQPRADGILPFRYVMVLVKEGVKVPMWTSLEDAREGGEPERQLEHGDTVAVDRKVSVDGVPHWLSVEGKVFPVKGSSEMENPSHWQGEVLDDKTTFPFGWITAEAGKVFATPEAKGKPIDTIARRTRVTIAEESGAGGKRMVRIGPGPDARWVRAAEVNEVRKLARPANITDAKQWIDVDLGEQVLVAYEGEKPVYATLTSSGRAIATPRGNYPVWAKVSSISMKSQAYEDKSYFVNKVPWVLFFQAHNAIHGAYWHDRFGVTKSHGCVNVSPLDARHLFDWLSPVLPAGWTGYRTENLLASPTVHVRNSHDKVELVQERPIGPPDKELEQQKLDDATERRAAASLTPTPTGAPTTPAGTGATGMQP